MSPKISRDLSNHRLIQASRIREDSDYDDEYVADPIATEDQIKTAEELIELVEKYKKSKEI